MLLLLAGATGVVATLQSFVETASGTEFQANQFPYYLGATAILVYCSAGVGLLFGGGATAALLSSLGVDDEVVGNVALGVAGVVTLIMAWALIDAGVLYDYEGTDTIGRFFVAAVGVLIVGGSVWYLFEHEQGDGEQA